MVRVCVEFETRQSNINCNYVKHIVIVILFLQIEPTENPIVKCPSGERGTGGICDCTNAKEWIEGQWWRPWCHEGKCYTGQKYDECIGKNNSHPLGDGTWCFNEERNTECQTKPPKMPTLGKLRLQIDIPL